MNQPVKHVAVAKVARSKRKMFTKKQRRAQRHKELLESYQPYRPVKRDKTDDREHTQS